MAKAPIIKTKTILFNPDEDYAIVTDPDVLLAGYEEWLITRPEIMPEPFEVQTSECD